MKKRNLTKIAGLMAAAAMWIGANSSANAALTFTQPLTLGTPNIVGTLTGQPGNGSPGTEVVYANRLLAMLMNSIDTTTIGVANPYKTSTTTEYGTGGIGSATVSVSGTEGVQWDKVDGGAFTIGGGWEYVLAKYDGENGGYVLYYLGGDSAILPQYPYDFWGTGTGANALSHFTAYNSVPDISTGGTPVPEPATMIAGALLLLPFGASTIRILRKNRTA